MSGGTGPRAHLGMALSPSDRLQAAGAASGSALSARTAQTGVASLVMLMLLLGVSVLMAAWSQRHVLTEWATANSQWRRALAFEAAESGLAWAQGMLNQALPLDSSCRADTTGAGTGTGYAARYLAPPDAAGQWLPRSRLVAGAASPLQMLCAQDNGRLACHCPVDAALALTVGGSAPAPSFAIQFAPSPRPGAIEVLATGCNQLARPCLPGAPERAEAVVRLRLTLAHLPALVTPPGAVLTTRGDIDAGAAALGLHNADARSGGLVAQAGGRIVASALRVQTVPGSSPRAALLGGDEALAATDSHAFFVRHFGASRSQWALQPGVQTIDCSVDDCPARVRALTAGAGEVARIAVRGDLQLDGPLQLGTASRPVVLVVEGSLQLRGAVELHGLVHATRLRWDAVAPGGGGLLRGAVLLDEGYAGDGAPDLVYDAALMRHLQRQGGTWVTVPGSWRDF